MKLSLTQVLTLIFIILKLTKNIDWGWWWVLSPMWIIFGLGIFLYTIYFILTTPEERYIDKIKKQMKD